MRIRENVNLIFSEVGKMTKIWLCYPILIFFWAIFPLLWVMPYMFQGKAFVGGLESAPFKVLTGTENYLAFVLIGAIVSTYVFSGLWGVGNSLREETFWGTLELIIVSPTQPIVVLIGKTVAEFTYATFMVTIQALLCTLFFGIGLTFSKLLPIFFILVLLLFGFYGFAIALAGLTLLIKETHGFIHTLEWVFYLFSPIRYPVEINPVTQFVSLLIPLTYALAAIRTITLLDRPYHELWGFVLSLLLIDTIIIGTGYYLFIWLEKKTRKAGTIGMH